MDTIFTLLGEWTPRFPRAFFQRRTHTEMSLLYTKYLLNIMSSYHRDTPWTVSLTFRTNQNCWGSKNRVVSVLFILLNSWRSWGVTMLKNHKVPGTNPARGPLLHVILLSLSPHFLPLDDMKWKMPQKQSWEQLNRTNKQKHCCTAGCNNHRALSGPPAGIRANSRARAVICAAYCATNLDPEARGLHAICICSKTDTVRVAMTKS